MPGIARSVIGIGALAVLGVLCALALPRGLADLRALEVRLLFRSWDAKRHQPSAEEWALAHEKLAEARALDPGQPNYLEDIARLHELRAPPQITSDALAQDDLRKALAFQREAVQRRPGSPYTWANIALLKARLAETDREFEAALRNAALLGPWEQELQILVADVGFRNWNALAPETRTALHANNLRALRWQDARLFELARRAGRLDVLCATPGVQRSPLARACI